MNSEPDELIVEGRWPRLDRFLQERIAGLSRSQLQKLIRSGDVLVNGQRVKAGQALADGDHVRVSRPISETTAERERDTPDPTVLFEDAHIVVVDKPAGLVAHRAEGYGGFALADWLLARRPEVARLSGEPKRLGIVHRLDRDTSGVMVLAVSEMALLGLQQAFRERRIDKTYLALALGCPEPEEGAIEAPLKRDSAERTKMAIVADGGRYARSEYSVVAKTPRHSVLAVRLITGRTHQIRVHLAAIGHPVVGDRVYGHQSSRLASRQMLHAWRLGLRHPKTGESLQFMAGLPSDFRETMDSLGLRIDDGVVSAGYSVAHTLSEE